MTASGSLLPWRRISATLIQPSPDTVANGVLTVIEAALVRVKATYGIGAVWRVPVFVEALSPHGLDVRLAADLVRWDSRKSGDTGNGFLWDVGITPYLRWRPADPAWHSFFVQARLGLHLVSHTTIDPGRQLSPAFQFGEALAAGVNFGPRGRYEVTAFVRHVSNADMCSIRVAWEDMSTPLLRYFWRTRGSASSCRYPSSSVSRRSWSAEYSWRRAPEAGWRARALVQVS